VIQQNGRTSKSPQVRLELEKFAEDAQRNLRSLKGKLGSKTFKFKPAKGVPIPKTDIAGKPTGKIRPIVLAPVESRIVQRAILNVLVEIEGLRPFVKTPYSFGGIRSNRRRDEERREDELSAVPAAIRAVLKEIENGARFVASADIRAFFTRISKSHVINVICKAIDDAEFIAFLREAINVELENIALLKEKAEEFPTEEIGVAQGNSLSPLLGNIALAEFDKSLNEGDCRCIRYIDDFIILAPSLKAANARLNRAKKILSDLGMDLSSEKSSKGGFPITNSFDFLGITISPGLIRPSSKSQSRFLASITSVFLESSKAMNSFKSGKLLERDRSLISTLKRVDGMLDGWGKHYWFCNDNQTFANMDAQVSAKISSFLGNYRSVRSNTPLAKQMSLLGLTELAKIPREAFRYPKLSASATKPQHAKKQGT